MTFHKTTSSHSDKNVEQSEEDNTNLSVENPVSVATLGESSSLALSSSTGVYRGKLIEFGISADLLDNAVKQGASIEHIYHALHVERDKNTRWEINFQHEWQLRILLRAGPESHWTKSDFLEQQDNAGSTPVHYFARSANINALSVINTSCPTAIARKNDHGKTIAHFATYFGHTFVLDWIKGNQPALLAEKTTKGITIAHYAALNGYIPALDWIKGNQPALLAEKAADGFTIAHVAALNGDIRVLDWIKDNQLAVLAEKAAEGSTIAHIAAGKGHVPVLDWIKRNQPALMAEKKAGGVTIAHSAVVNSPIPALDWIKGNQPALLAEKAGSMTIAHYAAHNGNIPALNWIEGNQPELLAEKTTEGFTIAHFAAGKGHIPALNWIEGNQPALLAEKTAEGKTIAYYAAFNGHVPVLDWIKGNQPALLAEKTAKGFTIAHSAVLNGHIPILDWIKVNQPALLAEKAADGFTIAHVAAGTGKAEIINYLLQESPALLKQLWIDEVSGKTPQNVARKDMPIKPNQLRDNALLAATNRLIEGQPSQNDAELLMAFRLEWHMCFLRDDCNLQGLVQHTANFPGALQQDIALHKPLFELMSFSFGTDHITKSSLLALCQLARNAMPATRRLVFFSGPPVPVLISQLQKFESQLTGDELTDQQVLCLHLIVCDYEQGFLGNNNSQTDVLVKKLLASVTLANLRPKAEMTTEMNIGVDNYSDYLERLKKNLSTLPLDQNTTSILHNIVLPGLNTLICDLDEIVNHVISCGTEVYYINGDLPIHTNHTTAGNREALRQTLNRLLIDCFAAGEIAHRKGLLKEFCKKISTGNCLEGRTRDALEWVSSLTEVVAFDTLMDRYINQEYIPYIKIMYGLDVTSEQSYKFPCEFIMQRHRGMPCLPDKVYAPDGEITEDGVKRFLIEVLAFDLEESTASDEQANKKSRMDAGPS